MRAGALMDLGSVLVRGSGSSSEVDGTAPPDPWTIGTGYSVRPVARAIKIKHAGLNPMVLGSASDKQQA
jgi:hypothetical protein